MTRRRSQTMRPPMAHRSGRMPAAALPADPPPERGAVRRWIRGALLDNVGVKLLSLVLAVTVFLLVNTDEEREIRVRAFLEYKYPADKVMISNRLEEVTVTIKGPWRRLRAFDEREIDRITLDLSEAPTGEVPISNDMINLPPGLSVVSIAPSAVRVAFDKRVEKTVEVTPVTGGRPEHGYVVTEQKVVPAAVRVRGGERLLAALTAVRTHEVSVQGKAESFNAQIDLALPAGVETDPGLRVTVSVRIDEELVTKRLPGVPVAIRGEGVDPARWAVEPAQIEVTLTGALLAIEKAKGKLAPYVRLTPADKGARGVEVTIDGIPPGVGTRLSPERVRVVPVKVVPARAVPGKVVPAPPP